jgi:hypothetical protein
MAEAGPLTECLSSKKHIIVVNYSATGLDNAAVGLVEWFKAAVCVR